MLKTGWRAEHLNWILFQMCITPGWYTRSVKPTFSLPPLPQPFHSINFFFWLFCRFTMDNPMWRKNCKNNKELMPNLSALNLANEEKGVNFWSNCGAVLGRGVTQQFCFINWVDKVNPPPLTADINGIITSGKGITLYRGWFTFSTRLIKPDYPKSSTLTLELTVIIIALRSYIQVL